MASILDEQNFQVKQNIHKLIKSLTGFDPSDENFKTCLEFTYSKIRNHRSLTVNSHEIKRDIDGICEKLRFSNLHDVEKRFKKICEECITSDVAVNHYEKDAIYSILNLLTTLAYDPIGPLKKKIRAGEEIFPFKAASIKGPSKASNTFISSLLAENFKLRKNETDSELSDWTDSDDDGNDKSPSEEGTDESQTLSVKARVTSSLKPPQKPKVFDTIRLENPEKWLRDNVQHSWWSDELTVADIKSTHPVANFCNAWQQHLSDKSMGFIKPRPYSLVTEYCLLREIFWMFCNPVDCKFFKVDDHEITVRPNVTLCSTMPESLNIFLADILRSINLMHQLKTACMASYQSSTTSHTMETYFNVVKSFLDRIAEFILEEEATVKSQQETYTVIMLNHKLKPHLKMLEMLWDIHSTSVLDDAKFPPHICAAYLLASLNQQVETSTVKEKKNLAIVLLIMCLRTYMEIFEIWWTQARLNDLKMEFLMEKRDDNGSVRARMLTKCKEKSFYVNETVSSKITVDTIIKLLLRFSSKASFTLDIIGKLDRVHEMKQIVNGFNSIYDEFVKRVNEEVKRFAKPQADVEVKKPIKKEASEQVLANQRLVEDVRSGMLANEDYLLLLAFQSTFDQIVKSETTDEPEPTHFELYERLNKASEFILLPVERSIQRILEELLDKKISIAERFVMNIYVHEFHIDKHIQEVRKVFFLESNELTDFFHLNLFPQMEAGEPTWANPYLLTVALNDAICSTRQQQTLFSVDINKRFDHRSVVEAVDDITLYCNVNKNLANVFTPTCMKKYNDAFRFLLKIKWGQRILNSLRFPGFFKRRAPYAKMQMIDLAIKRLSITRFTMQHAINTLHNNLLVMLQGLSLDLDAKIAKAQNISELISHHERFVDVFHKKSFLEPESANILGIIVEMLKLAKVLKNEWENITTFAALDEVGSIETLSLEDLNKNTIQIEEAFGVCEYQLKVLLDA